MEEQCSPLSWAYYYQEEGVEELKHSLLYSSLELEAALISSHEEISRKDDEILQLKSLIAKIIKDRDEFKAKSQQLALEKQLLFQQVQILAHSSKQHLDTCPSGTTSNEDKRSSISTRTADLQQSNEDTQHHHHNNIDMSPSSDDENDNINVAITSGCKDTLPLTHNEDPTDRVALKRPLPEQGKFLQAVMEAGPLLQTLLLAGPLPRWQHPPPQLSSTDIPPVTISSPTATKVLSQDSCFVSPSCGGGGGGFGNKRATMGNMDGSDYSPSSKYQKVCPPIIIDPII